MSPRCVLCRRGFAALVCLAFLAGPGVRAEAPRDDDPDALAPGLVASFSDVGEGRMPVVRVVSGLRSHWGLGAPDPRIAADEFLGRWTGSILIQTPGTHRFHARTDGSVTLKVRDRVILSVAAGTSRSEPIDLPAGLAPIVLTYRHGRGEARLAIDWEGPGFGREPVPSRLLYHEPGDSTRPDRFEDGRRLADRLGCANCHAVLDMPAHPELGPPLSDAGLAIDPRWLSAWLADPAAVRPSTRMPGLGHGLSPGEVADLAAFLAGVSSRPEKPSAEVRMALNVARPSRGQLLFASVGCLGCHSRGDGPPDPGGEAAPDLADLGRKRSEAWLASYLLHPKKGSNSRHRPDLRLTADESSHLASYLVGDPPPRLDGHSLPAGDAERGRKLVVTARCASCHAIPGLKPASAALPLSAGSKDGCLADRPSKALVPHFALTDDRRQALREFIASLPAKPSPTPPETLAQDTFRRLNCLGCHVRDSEGGEQLGARIASRLAREPDLGSLKGTLTPPNLTAVGDKLRPEYLALAVRGESPTARPWLSVRMPAFAFGAGEADSIVSAFQSHDRMDPEPDADSPPTRPDAATFERATLLIGQRGFGCVSCHVLAGKIPPGGEPETLGPDLALAHRRMPERYFHRWIGNPQRIIPGTPMPQFVKPVATAPGTLDDQLATLWQLLGSRRVAEAAATGTREVLKRQGDRALVVRDMVLLPGAPDTEYTPRGLAINLKNGQSLLFDTDRLTWLAWWRGGFLYRTKSGRLWEWHPDGEVLWTTPTRGAPIFFLGPGGKVVSPTEIRERFGRFAEIDFEGDGVSLIYVLNGPSATNVSVRERIQPAENGWERKIQVSDVPEGFQPCLAERPPVSREGAGGGWTWEVGKSRVSVRTSETDPPRVSLADDPATRVIPMRSVDRGRYTASVRLVIETGP